MTQTGRAKLLRGRRALITGGAVGIGAAIARRFVAEGAAVYLTDVDAEAVRSKVGTLGGEGTVAGGPLDVTDWEQSVAVFAAASERLGGLDAVVANAGLISIETLEATPLEELARVVNVNLLGVAATFKAAIPHLREAGGGVLLATASQASFEGSRELSAYAASKFAIRGLVEAVAAEVAVDGIRVCAVAPGMVSTPMLPRFLERRAELRGTSGERIGDEIVASIALGRLADPDEVADAFVYLASDLARYVTGTTLRVHGGM